MSRLSLSARMVGAPIVTAVLSSLGAAIGLNSYFLATTTLATDVALERFFNMALVVSWFGMMIALPMAIVLGLMLELPKSFWLVRRQGKFLPHLVSSVIVATALGGCMLLVTGRPVSPDDGFDFAVFIVLAFSLGGLVSASSWWRLVIVPWRKSQVISSPVLP